MSENSTCLGSGSGVGPARRPSTRRNRGSGLSAKPNRRSVSLKLAAIWGMAAERNSQQQGASQSAFGRENLVDDERETE
jgi:hypothetical protein